MIKSSAKTADTTEMTTRSPHENMFNLGKIILNLILASFFYAWYSLFGMYAILPLIYVAILLIPWSVKHFKERMEVRSFVVIYFSLLSIPIVLVWCAVRGGRFGITIMAAYVAWYTFCDDAPTRGGRFSHALRQRKFWRHFGAYFPMRLTRTEPLDPSHNYLFGYHPHGIISVGALCNFATEATGFAELFPGIDLRLLTLTMNFKIPLFREYLLGLGVNDVSRKSCERNLSRGPGSSIMIVVGGARESIETAPGHADLVLEGRKGFVKLALRKGASLVPVFSFGENDVFGVYQSGKVKQFQIQMQKKMGFAVPLFFGRALTGGLLHRVLGLNVGVLPLRVPIHSIVGRPIHLTKVETPTQEQVDAVHARYVAELTRIYEEWKPIYEKERAKTLSSYDSERLRVLNDKKFELYSNSDLSLVE